MSAGDRWHEHGPVKDADPSISPAVLLWMRGQGREEDSALPWEVALEAALRPEAAPANIPENGEVLATLLRALEGTEIAARFQGILPPENRESPEPATTQPAATIDLASTRAPGLASDTSTPTEFASDDLPGGEEALAILLRAIQNTEIAASVSGVPEADSPEPEAGASAQAEETSSALSPLPELEPAAHSAPPPDSECLPMPSVIEGAEVAANSESVPRSHLEEPAAIAANQPAPAPESAAAFELRIADQPRAASKQQNRQTKRNARRRTSNRERSDYLLSLAAPAVVPQSITTESMPTEAAALSASDKPLTVFLAPAVAEPPTRAVEMEPASAAIPSAVAQPGESLASVATPTLPQPISRPAAAEPGPPVAPPGPSAPVEGSPSETSIAARPGIEKSSRAATGSLINEGLDRAELQLQSWFQKWFGPPDPRHTARVAKPPVVAYHWIVDAPQALKVANISAGGLHLLTRERWSEGNIVSMTLQRTDKPEGSAESWIAVDFLVLRWCEDGMAGAFIASVPGLKDAVAGRAENAADKKTLERFVDRLVPAAQGVNVLR